MGYYTQYYLEVFDKDGEEIRDTDILHKITESICDLDYFSSCKTDYYKSRIAKSFDPINEIIAEDEMKWYDHESDMMTLSEKYPEFFFSLFGRGEEADDIWKEYFHNGKCIVAPAEIVFREMPLDEESWVTEV